MTTTTPIAPTKKGARIWLQGVSAQPTLKHSRYTMEFTEDCIRLYFMPDGKRGVTQSKGGVIDLESKKVLQWAKGATVAHVVYGPDVIHITKSQA